MPLKSDSLTADEADWEFAEYTDLVKALRSQAERAARRAKRAGIPHDVDEFFNEGALWLSARPHIWREAEDINHFKARVYSRMLRLVDQEANKQWIQEPLWEEEP